jgi:hypothetical protein
MELQARWVRASNVGDIRSRMEVAGDGARAIVAGMNAAGGGHFYNVVNRSGQILFLDGQSATFAGHYRYDIFKLLYTHD